MVEPLVSVVIPVYNAAPYLTMCVDSVLAQTHDSVEVFLIDDGSTDGSPRICDELAAAHAQVTVWHQENQGPGAARNVGIGRARGELITFLDADDWWDPSFLEVLVAGLATHDQVGIAMTLFARVPGAPCASPTSEITVLSPSESVGLFISNHHTLFAISCAKVYRRDVLGDERFVVGRLHEDEAMTHRLLMKERTVLVPQPLYFYRRSENSIMRASMTSRHLLDAIAATDAQVVDFLAAGHRRAAAWAQGQTFRKRMQLIGVLTREGRPEGATQQLAVLRTTLSNELPWSCGMKLLRLATLVSPQLTVRAMTTATTVRTALRRGKHTMHSIP